jgi:hypothetical protein
VGALRFVTVVCGAALFAAATTATAVGCKNGDYDGSFDGGFDAGVTGDGGTAVSRVVQPDKTETFASADNVIDVTFGPGTFAQPATITITSMGEQTLQQTGLIVPIYAVSADKEPAKFFQVSFHGQGNPGGGQVDSALVPALQTAGTFEPMGLAGAPNFTGGTGTYWGLTKTFGTYSLAYVTGAQTGGFADNAASCTAQCCHQTSGGQAVATSGGCFCSSAPDLACFLAHCSDLGAAAARCTAIAAGINGGNVSCEPFGAPPNCPGNPGCNGMYQGTCMSGGGGGGNNTQTCCIINKNMGSCNPGTCAGFSARCTATTACPPNTKCCVFATESYCAADCPAAQQACAMSSDCNDGGAEGGTCQGGGCPVGVCGTPPVLCQ